MPFHKDCQILFFFKICHHIVINLDRNIKTNHDKVDQNILGTDSYENPSNDFWNWCVIYLKEQVHEVRTQQNGCLIQDFADIVFSIRFWNGSINKVDDCEQGQQCYLSWGIIFQIYEHRNH